MALVNCTECGKEMSTTAAACPHCGAPAQFSVPPASVRSVPTASKRKPVITSMIAILVLIGIAKCASTSGSSGSTSSNTHSSAQSGASSTAASVSPGELARACRPQGTRHTKASAELAAGNGAAAFSAYEPCAAFFEDPQVKSLYQKVEALSQKEAQAKADAEAARLKQEGGAEAAKEDRFKTVVGALILIKRSARNPDSLVWEEILANDDASIICIAVRGQNGFGGYSREYYSFKNGVPSETATAWNKNCANKSLNDMKHAQLALRFGS